MTTLATGQLSPSTELAIDWAWAAARHRAVPHAGGAGTGARTGRPSRRLGRLTCWWEPCWRIRTRMARAGCCCTTLG